MEARRSKLGANHPSTLISMGNLVTMILEPRPMG